MFVFKCETKNLRKIPLFDRTLSADSCQLKSPGRIKAAHFSLHLERHRELGGRLGGRHWRRRRQASAVRHHRAHRRLPAAGVRPPTTSSRASHLLVLQCATHSGRPVVGRGHRHRQDSSASHGHGAQGWWRRPAGAHGCRRRRQNYTKVFLCYAVGFVPQIHLDKRTFFTEHATMGGH